MNDSVFSPIESNECSCTDVCLGHTSCTAKIHSDSDSFCLIRRSSSTTASPKISPASISTTYKRKAASLDEEVVDIDAYVSLDKMANDALELYSRWYLKPVLR